MQGSKDRVRAVIQGRMPDRAPMFDLLRNDAVIEHFTGQRLTLENAAEVVPAAFAPAVDATRPSVRLPGLEKTITLEDGRQQRHYRWTIWTEHRHFADSDAWAAEKRRVLAASNPQAWNAGRQSDLDHWLASVAEQQAQLGEVFFMPSLPGPGLMSIYDEIGLESLVYAMADCPGVVEELLECNALFAIAWAEHLPADHGIEAGFLGDDIAFNAGTLLRPDWMREHFFPRLARVIAAMHRRGIRILYHSDGNLNAVLNDLVAAGIDGLNPIEVLAGMDVGDIHRRHPKLWMAGGIDVSQLLPFGTPAQVKDAVRRAIDAAEGRLMVGSSTELNDEVPLANYLALREAVLEHPY
ncbi:MAG: hypothetical protein IT442_03330 [Phycisphaeraceae bacterium]|nr:hypothetical protein [Phycisphaeraceae bacterium]